MLGAPQFKVFHIPICGPKPRRFSCSQKTVELCLPCYGSDIDGQCVRAAAGGKYFCLRVFVWGERVGRVVHETLLNVIELLMMR